MNERYNRSTLLGKRGAKGALLFIPGASPEQAREMQAAARRPEGTLVFSLDGARLYDQPGDFIMLRIPTGAVLIELEGDSERRLRFTHASPGTGSRVASLELPEFIASQPFRVALAWSPAGIHLYAGFVGTTPVAADGVTATQSVRVERGAIFEIAGEGVMGYEVRRGGDLVLRETAIESWHSVGVAVDVHLVAEPSEGHLGKTVQANLAIVMLATGLETFLARCFREMDQEGRTADVPALVKALVSRGLHDEYRGLSLEQVLDERRLDFGDYEQAKRAYRSAYGLSFGALGLSSTILHRVKRLIHYRNRIVHVSPLTAVLNADELPRAKPVFALPETVVELRDAADEFVEALLKASLEVK